MLEKYEMKRYIERSRDRKNVVYIYMGIVSRRDRVNRHVLAHRSTVRQRQGIMAQAANRNSWEGMMTVYRGEIVAM